MPVLAQTWDSPSLPLSLRQFSLPLSSSLFSLSLRSPPLFLPVSLSLTVALSPSLLCRSPRIWHLSCVALLGYDLPPPVVMTSEGKGSKMLRRREIPGILAESSRTLADPSGVLVENSGRFRWV
eukprot:1376853-Amorphochlora_amoeboformis.AAC.1